MNGMERLKDAAARHGWTRREDPAGAGYSRTVVYRRGDQSLEVYRRVDGGVIYGSRNWGPWTIATAPKVAEQVLAWMQEPTPDDDTDRGFFFRLATSHGWTFRGIDSGDVYAWGADRITLRFGPAGVLKDAQRNFGGPDEVREFHTNVPANITPWFHAFLGACAPVCACSTEPERKASQEAAKPVIRPALPNTPDRKLWRLTEEVEDAAGAIRRGADLEVRPEFSVDALKELSVRLEDLEAQVRTAKQEALYLWAERKYGATFADVIRQIHARENRG